MTVIKHGGAMRAKEIPFTLYAAWTNFTRVYGMTKKRR